MSELHILFTGTGRRVELLQAFRQAAMRLGVRLKLYGADMAANAPASAFCDHTRRICAMRDGDYIPQLLEICRRDRIDLLIPTIDTDLIVLSENRERFAEIGTRVMISSPEMVALCRDKNNTYDFFLSCGLKAPEPVNDYRKYAGPYPCFIKPKDGSSSINAFRVEEERELEAYAARIGDYIIQPFIDGTEYTIDIFCDFDGKPIYIVPRERIAVRSGEVLKTRITLDGRMIEEAERLVERFRPCGAITVQLIRQRESEEDYYIEINPRYGGGAPLSMKAGADSPEALMRLMLGERLGYRGGGIRDGAVFSRFDQSICIVCESGHFQGRRRPVRGVIFDLDDTLYAEKQYVRSGFRAVARYLGSAGAENRLWEHFLAGRNAVDALLEELGQQDRKKQCLDAYRTHMPAIELYEGAEALIRRLKEAGIRVGIITDGRVEGQRNKLKALGLNELIEDIIITDELGGESFRKPNDIAFRIMQCRWGIPFEEMVYVGDNLYKDFQAPRQLGMGSVCFENRDGLYYEEGLYADDCDVKIQKLSDVLCVIL